MKLDGYYRTVSILDSRTPSDGPQGTSCPWVGRTVFTERGVATDGVQGEKHMTVEPDSSDAEEVVA
eukprot:7338566-Lingulodinium_polyedra.AAC.1